MIQLDYAPRKAFMPFHNRTERWACLVAHRRAGKTVAAINDLIRAALMCKSKYPLFAYIAPFRAQAKAVAWTYLKSYAQPIMADSNESELTVTLVNGAVIRLFGADSADGIRGLGFDGVVADEFGDWKPSVFPLVVRPALSDKQGWFVAMGTPKGRNSFYDVYARAKKSLEWFCMSLPADKSGLLPPTELEAARAQLTTDQYDQEYLCSFDAAIVGAYYGVDLRRADTEGRITKVPYDIDFPVYTAWDLGYTDDTAIWFYQVVKGEVHILDFHASSGSTIEELAKVVLSKPYKYGKHNLPHDARAKTLASGGKSVIEQMAHYLGISNLAIVPNLSVQDGIQAVRMMLHRCWFDADKTADGLEALRQYQREFDEDKKAFRDRPVHNWCSHPADAFRMLAIAWREEPQPSKPLQPKPLMVGPENEVTLNEMWAVHESQSKRSRI